MVRQTTLLDVMFRISSQLEEAMFPRTNTSDMNILAKKLINHIKKDGDVDFDLKEDLELALFEHKKPKGYAEPPFELVRKVFSAMKIFTQKHKKTEPKHRGALVIVCDYNYAKKHFIKDESKYKVKINVIKNPELFLKYMDRIKRYEDGAVVIDITGDVVATKAHVITDRPGVRINTFGSERHRASWAAGKGSYVYMNSEEGGYGVALQEGKVLPKYCVANTDGLKAPKAPRLEEHIPEVLAYENDIIPASA